MGMKMNMMRMLTLAFDCLVVRYITVIDCIYDKVVVAKKMPHFFQDT